MRVKNKKAEREDQKIFAIGFVIFSIGFVIFATDMCLGYLIAPHTTRKEVTVDDTPIVISVDDFFGPSSGEGLHITKPALFKEPVTFEGRVIFGSAVHFRESAYFGGTSTFAELPIPCYEEGREDSCLE